MRQLARQLDDTWREVADRFDENTEVSICTDGKHPSLTISNLDKLEESLSLKTLNRRVKQLIPPVDLTELLLEVDAWTGFTQEFTHVTRQERRGYTSVYVRY